MRTIKVKATITLDIELDELYPIENAMKDLMLHAIRSDNNGESFVNYAELNDYECIEK
jgi:hypothetical protein